MSQLFAWGVQSIGVSASKSVSWKINTCFIVNPTGNQPWISLEALMLKMKLKYFGHLMQRVDSLEKTWMLGKIIGKRRMGWQRTRCLDSIINSMDMNLSKFREIVENRRAWHAAVYGVPKSGTQFSNWTTTKVFSIPFWRWKQSNKHFSFASGWEQISQLSPAIKRLTKWPTYLDSL